MPATNDSRLLIVNYHYIRPKSQYPHPGIHPVGKRFFSEQIKWLKDRFHMAAPDEVEDFFSGGNPLPGPSIFLTFDDGLIEHEMAAGEILAPLDIKGAFFVSSQPLTAQKALMVHKIHWLRATIKPEEFYTQFVNLVPDEWRRLTEDDTVCPEALKIYIYDTPQDARLKYMINFQLPASLIDSISSEIMRIRKISEAEFCEKTYMSTFQIKRLSAEGHEVGCHGHCHNPFSLLADQGLLEQDLSTNISTLDKIVGKTPRWVSYPYGPIWSIPENESEILGRLGLEMGFCLDKKRIRWNTGAESRYRIDRINTNHVKEMCPDPKNDFI